MRVSDFFRTLSRQRTDNFAVLVFVEGLQSLGGHAAQSADGQYEFGAGLVVVAGGAWAVFTFLWPHEAPSPEAPKIVCAEPGGVAAGRDASGNTITINGNAQVALGAKPCVEAGKAR